MNPMITRLSKRGVALAFTVLGVACGSLCFADNPYQLLKEIPLSGKGRVEFMELDGPARRLYIGRGTVIAVLDLNIERVVVEMTNSTSIRGLALLPRMNQGFGCNGQDPELTVMDLRSLRVQSKMKIGHTVDEVVLEPSSLDLYALHKQDKSVSILEADDGDVMANIKLPDRPLFAVADAYAGRVYCGLEDSNELVVIDSKTRALTGRWPVAPGEGPSCIAADGPRRVLFVGTRNKLILVLNNADGKVLATVPASGNVNAITSDPAGQSVFAASEGSLTVARLDASGKLTVLQTLETPPGARALALDPLLHRVYLATSRSESDQSPVPNSSILVYGPRGMARK